MAQIQADRDIASLIEDFGKTYIEEEWEHWGAFLWHVHQKCEDLVRGKVQASVTSRVKQWISLEKKLKTMYLEPKDRRVKEIKAEDIHDIAALRIRAFFPKQLPLVYKIVEENFNVQKKKPFKPDWKNPDKLEAYDERFGNYEGQHYWVEIRENDWQNLVPESLLPIWRKKFEKQRIEIQVRSSMLLDGWAEVRHDIQYKALGGAPSRGERELLDTMKGVVKSMEVLLDHLLDVHEDRIKSDNTKLETAPLLEQALVRALPQLSLSYESIDNMEILHPFLEAVSIDTPGRFKEVIRKSKFSEKFVGFCESRKISKQPVWTFILEEVFMTLSETEIKELLEKVSETHELHQVFCRSISWLEEHLFVREYILQKPLESDETGRSNVIWYLHEYVSATWPKYKPSLHSLLENLLSTVKNSPVPRVDTSLYVAIAETLAGKQYRLPETPILEKLQNPNLRRRLRECRLPDERWLCDNFRWHRHDLFYGSANASEKTLKSSKELSAALLRVSTHQLHGAVLHRAVCHEDEEKNVGLVKQLLKNITDSEVLNFQNSAGQSTLHAATIFSPTFETVKLILSFHGVDVNKADKCGETALLTASILNKREILSYLLEQATINVNLSGGLSPETMAVFHWNPSLMGLSDPFCQFYAPENIACGLGRICNSVMKEKTSAEWYALKSDWFRLGIIARNPSFKMLESFKTWRYFFQIMQSNIGTTRECFLENAKKAVNNFDKDGHRALCGLLHAEVNSKKEWVSLLLDMGANASLPCCRHGTHTLTQSQDLEVFQLILGSMSPSQLMVKDDQDRNALHQMAGGITRFRSPFHYLDKLLKSGCDRYLSDIQGRTWIHHAVASNMRHPLTSLLEECCNESPSEFRKQLKAGDNDGWTPLHWLCFALPKRPEDRSEWEERLRFLLRNGVDPDLPCKHGWTPRHILILLKHMKSAKCCQLLPSLQDTSPVDSVPESILRVFYSDGSDPSQCDACHIEHAPFIGHICTECATSLCFKCGRTKEKTHQGHRFSESRIHGTKTYLDDLNEEIRRAPKTSASTSEIDDR